MARDHATVLPHAREPSVHVVDNPGLVAGLVREEIGVGRKHRRHKVNEMIAHHLVVVAIVIEKFRKRTLAVAELEARQVKRIAHPIERGGRS